MSMPARDESSARFAASHKRRCWAGAAAIHSSTRSWRDRRAHGIERSREGRHAALLALAARLPAPILAERLGSDQPRAAGWVGMAGATYADYVAARLAD